MAQNVVTGFFQVRVQGHNYNIVAMKRIWNLHVNIVKEVAHYTPTNCEKRRKPLWNDTETRTS